MKNEAKSLKKHFGLEIGKTYFLSSGEAVMIESIGRRVYDKVTLLGCLSLKDGKAFDARVNDAAYWRKGL